MAVLGLTAVFVVDSAASLPGSGAITGQLGMDTSTGTLYRWDGDSWEELPVVGNTLPPVIAASAVDSVNSDDPPTEFTHASGTLTAADLPAAGDRVTFEGIFAVTHVSGNNITRLYLDATEVASYSNTTPVLRWFRIVCQRVSNTTIRVYSINYPQNGSSQSAINDIATVDIGAGVDWSIRSLNGNAGNTITLRGYTAVREAA